MTLWNRGTLLAKFVLTRLLGALRMFDYGRAENIKRYGTETPPEYHLEKITNKYIALMSSQNDWLSDPDDVIALRKKLRGNFRVVRVAPVF